MANECYVASRKAMTATQITDMLHALNKRVFYNKLKINGSKIAATNSGDPGNMWVIELRHHGSLRLQRACWLSTPRRFHMRHGGGGGTLAWWVDTVIVNEVSVQFNGRIHDEGISDTLVGTPNRFDHFTDYVDELFRGCEQRDRLARWELSMVPKIFRSRKGADGN